MQPSSVNAVEKLASSDSDHEMTVLTVIQPSKGWSKLGLRDVWEYRELLIFLIWREIQGVYRQTALGISWLFVRPLLNMLLLTFVFGYIVGVPSDEIPYPLFALSALLPWGYFSNAVLRASRSLVDNLQLISKVYFPRMIIPISGAVSGLVDFAAAFLIMCIALIIYRIPFRLEILWIPFLLFIAVAYALGVGFWLATLSVRYRDVSFAVNFLIQALMYLSPVIYPVSRVPEALRLIYLLNPMTGVIQGFRWALFGSGDPPSGTFIGSAIIVMLVLISGAYIFRRTERNVVDIL
jgi:lipopolysaccharide transport system permease protein